MKAVRASSGTEFSSSCMTLRMLVNSTNNILLGQICEPDHGPRQVDHAAASEGILSQPGLEGLVAVQAAAGVHQEFGRPAHDESKVSGGALPARRLGSEATARNWTGVPAY